MPIVYPETTIKAMGKCGLFFLRFWIILILYVILITNL
ncbi:hypothetical protein AC062_1172 [Pasteurellaceae bacterium NI1060]|nr:hypothetical protein AC062_1172 [Pasteurellaceae bacterium NI1060]